MTIAPATSPFALQHRGRTALAAALALALAATLAACALAAEDEPTNPDAEPAEIAEDTTDDGAEEAPDAGGYTSDDLGNATIRVNGTEFPGFTGDCEITRNFGTEDVGDLNEGDITMIIGIDNVEAQEEQGTEDFMNYRAISEESFRFSDLAGTSGVDTPATGEITSLTELSPRSADGSRDIVQIRVAGVVEDGTPLEVDIVCELQNQF